jgi:hypothetical protein
MESVTAYFMIILNKLGPEWNLKFSLREILDYDILGHGV